MIGSAQGQDQFVVDLLGGQRGGYFLDSGASDGVEGNNTLRLETEYGWRGICVEPNPAFFAELVTRRTAHCVSCCLYDREGEVDFVEASTLGGILDEYHPDLLRYARDVFDVPDTVRRPARTIASILREAGAPRVIDYWSLDTEGSELAILKSFPFADYRVRIITVEHNHFPVRDEIHELLTGLGYHRVCELAIDDAYVHGDDLVPSGWRSRAWRRR
jgi:FkbM family methyltransferase